LEKKILYFENLTIENNLNLEVLEEDRTQIMDQETIEDLETKFESKENKLLLLSESLHKLKSEKTSCQEYYQVLEKGLTIYHNSNENQVFEKNSQETELLEEEEEHSSNLGSVSGVILRSRIPQFQLLCYRQTRGNMIFKTEQIQEKMYDRTNSKNVSYIEMNVFVIFFSANKIGEKIQKIAQAMGASLYSFPSNPKNELVSISEKIKIINETISTTKKSILDILSEIYVHLDRWKKKIKKEKETFLIMNMFDYRHSNYTIAEAWAPKSRVEEITTKLKLAQKSSHSEFESHVEIVNTKDTPPTYFQLNKFTQCFQDIVEAYGIPSYREINPAVISITTFPFLFAVMYGDLGHGVIISLLALAMCVFEDQLKFIEENEIGSMLFGGRYVILLMGLFSIYTGIIYNDFFGLPLDLLTSRYTFNTKGEGAFNSGNTYEFGVDPAWYMCSNKISFYNSLKMKMAIIFGVSHMMIGLITNLFNRIQFREYILIIIENIPEFLLLGTLYYKL
jgi:V-type H+-transporting ATPase subunit a